MAIDPCIATAIGIDDGGVRRSLRIFRSGRGFYVAGDGVPSRTPPAVETLDHLAQHVAHRYRLREVTLSPHRG